MGMFEQALVCARQALAISKDCFGTPHPRVAIALNNLARMLEECGHHAEALEPLQQAREMSESIYGAGHPQMATVLVGLGSLYRKLGNLPEARQCCERALSIAEASLGPDHVEVAIALATLSHVLYSQRELTAARSAAERAVAILGCMEDSDPSHLAEALAGLACMQEEQGAREQAILTQERAIALYERVLGANHPDIATLLRNLGMFHLRAGELGRALPLFERALAIDDLVDGSRSPRIVQERLICAQGLFQAGAHEPAVQLVHRVLSLCAGLETVPSSTFEDVLGLGKALVDRGDWALSKTLLARTLRLEDRLAPDEAQRAELRVLLGTALVRGERPEPPPAELDEAKRLLEQALGAERVLSAEMLTRTLNELGYIFGVRGELSEARACFERALAIVEAHPPPDSHPVAAIALQLGKVLVAQQDYSAAHPHITRAWSLCERHLKQDHPEFELMRREACVYLGEVLLRLGKYRLALQHLEKARNLVVKAVGMEHPGSAYNLMQIALCHAGLGKPWKALPKLKRALEMLERREGPEHPLAREIRVWIQRLSG
ncbi:MAG TPA: tetratricopeptide repeat protein [Archangium sp.]|nr:tetratricopeptide repeat protein [Archangium sp.]